MKRSLVLLLILVAIYNNNLYSQGNLIHKIESDSLLTDAFQIPYLDSVFSKVSLIGMGESTHGTREFSVSRLAAIKVLVKNHGLHTIYLEADYANCLRANRYIHGATDDLHDVVRSIGLWPWMTEEFADLIHWMRDYNQGQNTKLQIIGVDVANFRTTINEIDKLLFEQTGHYPDTSIYQNLTDYSFIEQSWQSLPDELKTLHTLKENQFQQVPLGESDKKLARNLTRQLRYILEGKEHDFLSYRDIKMAENILYHQKNAPQGKALFWAHNQHIFKIYNKKRKIEKSYITTGGFLSNALKDSYYVIAQDFNYGTFNAYKVTPQSSDKFDLGVVRVRASVEGSFGYRLSDSDRYGLLLFTDDFSREEFLTTMHHEGAVFYPSSDDPQQVRSFRSCNECYDAILIINKSTPTSLLR